ncbi:pirin family protein, partial [Burkholderia sp. SIMBA_057]
DGAGVKLTRIINQPGLKHQDPFLMLDEFRSDNPDDYIAGFPPHPHRGFCTLTYMLAGTMEHKDSVGNSGEVDAGGVARRALYSWLGSGTQRPATGTAGQLALVTGYG